MAALLMPRRSKGMRTRLGCLSHKSDSCSDFTAILPDKPSRALKRLSTEEAARWADSFDVLLAHKYGVAAFRAFLKTEFSEENLEFWLACEDFKKTRSAAKLASRAHRIFEEFVDVQAPREVRRPRRPSGLCGPWHACLSRGGPAGGGRAEAQPCCSPRAAGILPGWVELSLCSTRPGASSGLASRPGGVS
uniref:Regulator of G-protein signaling 8 n=1 Tax=Oryctolagus cuniculus TaxID=9986 RepID=A0A5F9C498_RABIT